LKELDATASEEEASYKLYKGKKITGTILFIYQFECTGTAQNCCINQASIQTIGKKKDLGSKRLKTSK
jgi:hypothetical protein